MAKPLSEFYYNFPNPSAYTAVKQLKLQSKKPVKEIKQWLSNQRTYTLHKQIKRRYLTRPYRAKYRNQFWEADLVDMQNYAIENKNFRYMLTCIDIFSRYGFALPLLNKTKHQILNAFGQLFSKFKSPHYLSSDEGKGFKNDDFQKFLTKHKVKQFFRTPPFKAAVCERFNRTIKSRIEKYFTHRGNHIWIDILPDAVTAYNHAHHRTMLMTPREAYDSKIKPRSLLFKRKEKSLQKSLNKSLKEEIM